MRTRTASIILGVSASIMLVGLGLARAQDRPEAPTDRPQPGGRQPSPPGPAGQAKQQQRQVQEQEPEEGPAQGMPPQFQTGIEYEPMSPRAMVTFNLEDASLPDLVRLISNITGKRFILPGKVRSIKASVYAPTKVPVAAAYSAFLSILEVNGMTVVRSGRYLKIVETQGVESQPLPTGRGRVPRDERYVTHIEQVENVAAEDVSTLLGRFKSQTGSVTAYAPTNMVIITDTGANIRRMMRIVRAIDVPRTGEQIWIEPIHYANAAELAEKLQEIFPVGEPAASSGGSSGGKSSAAQRAARARARARQRAARRGGKGSQGGGSAPATVGSATGSMRVTKIIPEERSNSLIIMATERAYLRILELIRQLDVPLEGEGRIHVHYVQHSDAEEIASTLESLVQGGGGGQSRRQGGQGGGGSGPGATASLFEGEVRVTAHDPSNALVITSSPHDYAELRRVIERLDEPRRQVFIEAVIMELSVNRTAELGLSFHGGIADAPGDGSLTVLGFDAMNTVLFNPQETLTGMAVGVQGPIIPESQQLIGASVPAFGVVLNALATSGDTNVLSTPHIIAMDNTEAEISVGENVPLQTSGVPAGIFGGLGGVGNLAGLAGQTGQQGAAGAGALAGLGGGLAGSVQRQDVGTTIRITPHINDNNEIRMEIEEEISEAGPIEGDLGVRSIRRREARTEVMVRDNQTVVIGGLMRDEVVHSERKIPILGDIPVLGILFRETTKEKRKTNLLLFLTPYIIRDPADLRAIFERKMRERQEFLDRFFVFGDDEYQPPVDYSRTRGLVAEMLNEIKAIEVEAELQREAEKEPPRTHSPRPPIGSAAEMGVGGEPEEGMIIEPDDAEEASEPEPEPEPEVEVDVDVESEGGDGSE